MAFKGFNSNGVCYIHFSRVEEMVEIDRVAVCSVLCVCVLLRVCVLLLRQDWCQLVHTLVEASPSWTAHLQVQTSASHSHTLFFFHSLLQNSLLLNSKW